MKITKTIYKILSALIIVTLLILLIKNYEFGSKKNTALDPMNSTYDINGQEVNLKDGFSNPAIAPQMITRYFGNSVQGDINADGIPDEAFILTQTMGGTGVFYYVAALISTPNGYKGTNAILLGDRISPQAIEFRGPTESHYARFVVNYADRKPTDSMTTPPSVGVSRELEVHSEHLIALDQMEG